MLLIVEGSNKVGKSTLIAEIKKYVPEAIVLDCRTHKLFTDFEDTKKANYAVGIAVYNMVKSIHEADPNALVILDRFHLSEIVYGILDRNYHSEGMMQIDELLADEQHAGFKTRLIHMMSQYNHLDEFHHPNFMKYKRIQLVMSVVCQYSKIERRVFSLDGKDEIGPDSVNFCLQPEMCIL